MPLKSCIISGIRVCKQNLQALGSDITRKDMKEVGSCCFRTNIIRIIETKNYTHLRTMFPINISLFQFHSFPLCQLLLRTKMISPLLIICFFISEGIMQCMTCLFLGSRNLISE